MTMPGQVWKDGANLGFHHLDFGTWIWMWMWIWIWIWMLKFVNMY